MKEDLPAVQFANPELEVQVNRVPKSPADTWKAEMQLDFSESLIYDIFLYTLAFMSLTCVSCPRDFESRHLHFCLL